MADWCYKKTEHKTIWRNVFAGFLIYLFIHIFIKWLTKQGFESVSQGNDCVFLFVLTASHVQYFFWKRFGGPCCRLGRMQDFVTSGHRAEAGPARHSAYCCVTINGTRFPPQFICVCCWYESIHSFLTVKSFLKMPATSEMLTERTVKKSRTVGFQDEQGYLDLVEHIMETGKRRGDRTGTGVVSVFGAQSRYSLRGIYDIVSVVLHKKRHCFFVFFSLATAVCAIKTHMHFLKNK